MEENRETLEQESGRDEGEAFEELILTRHNSVKGATTDLDRFQFNTAISRHMELTNALYAYAAARPVEEWGEEARKVVDVWVHLLAPFAPHLGEELWTLLGREGSVFDAAWPAWDEAALVRDVVTVVVQVNGKVRDQMEVPRGTSREALQEQALAYGRVPQWVEGKQVRKVIIVPDKLVNIVVG